MGVDTKQRAQDWMPELQRSNMPAIAHIPEKDSLNNLSDLDLRRVLLPRASVSTTALSVVDTRLPARLLVAILRAYLTYYRVFTGATHVEVYATEAQEQAIQVLGIGNDITSYHIPWQKNVPNLARLVDRPHPLGTTATIHALEWVNHFRTWNTGQPLVQNQSELMAVVCRSEPGEVELDLLDRAATHGLVILFETVVDRELYPVLHQIGKTHEEYLFEQVDYVRRLRDAWLARHGDSVSSPEWPVGIVLNPWHAAVEMRATQIMSSLRTGKTAEEIRDNLFQLLQRYVNVMEGMVSRYYVGNSRSWEMRLPEILQRGHFLDSHGIVPELAILRHLLARQPELAEYVTLEASPQSAVFSGRLFIAR